MRPDSGADRRWIPSSEYLAWVFKLLFGARKLLETTMLLRLSLHQTRFQKGEDPKEALRYVCRTYFGIYVGIYHDTRVSAKREPLGRGWFGDLRRTVL